jgi:hypothetical protein
MQDIKKQLVGYEKFHVYVMFTTMDMTIHKSTIYHSSFSFLYFKSRKFTYRFD